MITRKELTTQQGPLIGRKLMILICLLITLTISLTIIFNINMHRQLLVATTTSSNEVTQQQTTTISTSLPAFNASKVLVRINQNSVAQYADQQEHDLWSPSTCSAASLTEVINAYGHAYRITDILKIEAGIGAITPDLGLLKPTGIDDTAARFGFTTQTLSNPTVEQVIHIANGGRPVIINFPPPVAGGNWLGGHFLVVLGDATIKGVRYVHLADSSKLNMEYMKIGSISQWGTFLYYWRGLAKVLSPVAPSSTSYSVVGKPTISAAFINKVLAAYYSPAADKGQALYDDGVQYGIDPAFALAFFMHESTFGTAGEARLTLALGNLRCIPNRPCVNTAGTPCQTGQSCYAKFYSWEDGFQTWYQLIRNLYVADWGKTTIDQIIPIYAPPTDNNDDSAYINALKHEVATWRAGIIKP